ncbi:organic cation transporter protein-like isoform X1 [Sinocyclocheilus anshuiensis]|uniref:organic cation transporter protein-like isoform X1 n=1 Tax=Sinocyclocheilus anshuiensis TaxID=1608454 RepID=UPI0007BAB6A8|nr:PREDICTED: organic cation transporter protein-like isoform X1 [Sinocyclocheilus anshuiensis]
MNFDEVLDRIGGFGRFQKTLYVWICLPQIFLAFHMLVSVFTGAVPPHLCRSAWPAGDSGGTGLGFNFSIAPGESCTSFQDGPLSQLNHSLPITEHSSTSNGCTGGWEFSKEVFLSTVVTEWDLVCENATLNNIGSSIYMFGLLVGAVLFGALADKYGRRIIILIGLAAQAIFGVGVAFAPNFYIYVLLRFVVGMTISAVIMNAFVLGTEWTGPKKRMLAGVITDYFFGFGYILLAGVAYLIRDWRKLQLAISAPGFLFLFYIWVLPKSARWLMANKKHEEALDLIHKAALINGKPLVDDDIEVCQSSKISEKLQDLRKYTVIDLVRTPRMRKQSLILFYLWFVNVLVYYGLSLNISDFGMNIYLTQMIFGLVEMPARTITLFTLNRSRRISQLAFLAVGGLACLLTIFIPDDLSVFRTVLAMVGKFGITASLSIVYIYSAEVFPTVIRQNGIGMGSMCARAGGVIAPIIYLLRNINRHAPMVVFGLCPLIGAALTMFLPETAHKPLPDTIEDVERTGVSTTAEKSQHALYEECPKQNPDVIL